MFVGGMQKFLGGRKDLREIYLIYFQFGTPSFTQTRSECSSFVVFYVKDTDVTWL